MSRRSRACRPCGDRGAAVVEFALIMPILLLLVFGIIQYGLYFWAMQGGSDIARSAARMSAAGDPAACDDFRERVEAEIDDLAGTSNALVERTYTTAAGPEVNVGDTVTVVVTFDSMDLNLPLPFVEGGEVRTTARARVDYVRDQPEECTA